MILMYDLIIIGSGPAGLTAAIFARRQGMNTLVLDNPSQPSNMEITPMLENYPGFGSITGKDLIDKMKKQVNDHGCEIKQDKVIVILRQNDHFLLKAREDYGAKAVILATGLKYRKANVPGEEKFLGKGVSYCVVCDGPLFKNRDIAIIGGGDSAVKGALFMEGMAKNVYIIHRRNELRAEKILQDRLFKSSIKILWDSVAEEITGKDFVESIKIRNVKTDELSSLPVNGVFMEIGSVPATNLIKDLGITLDNDGFIIVNEKRETNVPGIFAAGDISNNQLKQDITAAADGAIAAISAYNHIKVEK
jgi:thioredoxin reductase (NADPH)